MSQSYGEGAAGASGVGTSESSGTVQTAAHEASGVANTAAEQAGGVLDTAKSEAGAVAHEAKNQVKDLYHQTRSELQEQAATQQRRVADGLKSVGGELNSMADNAEGGVASDLVRQASGAVQGVAGWIGDRDPGSLLSEVKSYARRKPGMFIAAAALAGLVAGRLTRALSEGGTDSASGSSSGTGSGASGVTSPGASPAGSSPFASTGSAAGSADIKPAVPAAATVSAVPASAGAGSESGPLPTDGTIPGAPDGMSGIDAGTAPWGVDGENDARADTPVFNETDAARGSLGEERP
jgi:ElaB/YqjD/DUF883 family membrane-anchored ribosome-binding protein